MTPYEPAPQPDRQVYAEPQQIGVTEDGKAIYRYPQQPAAVHHHHYPPAAPARRGLQPGEVLGWLGVAGAAAAVLLAVAVSAVAIAVSAVAVAILALVLRGIWKDIKPGR